MSNFPLRNQRLEPSARNRDYRTEFDRDYGRLIHSPTFRRLQGKSQVFGAGSGDYYRTRLTHSLEVAQIARQVASRLRRMYGADANANPGLMITATVVECAALAHDLGHPPFGHKGEAVLNELLKKESLAYEGNAQNFRWLMFLEKRSETLNGKSRPINGLNLTAAVLLATNKYPYEVGSIGDNGEARKKGLYPSEWQYIKGLREKWQIPDGKRTVEAQLMDLCDDVAYSTHDIEDGIRAGKIRIESLRTTSLHYQKLLSDLVVEVGEERDKEPEVWAGVVNLREKIEDVLIRYADHWQKTLSNAAGDASRARREQKAHWLGVFLNKIGLLPDGGWTKVTFVTKTGEEDLQLRQTMIILKKLAWVMLVKDFRVQRLQQRSDFIIRTLWKNFADPENGKKILPTDWLLRYEAVVAAGEYDWPWHRLVADYISGFTDAYAERVFGELHGGSRFGSIYDMD